MGINKIPVIREADGELLGYIAEEQSSWTALTIFGYMIARVETRGAAETVIRDEGLQVLQGMWRYLDADREWYPCILKRAYEDRVVIVRTNELGFQDPDHAKPVIINNPTETNLQKA